MPFASRDGVRLYWKLDGAEDRPPVMLLNSIGTDLALWDSVVPDLLSRFRVLRMDTRGFGASDAPASDYNLTLLAEDVLCVLDAAGIDQAAMAGISLGGMIAMELALLAPERLSALVLICTSAKMAPQIWTSRIEMIRAGGMEAIAELSLERFLSIGFAKTRPEIAAGLRRTITQTAPEGYIGAATAIRDMDLLGRISAIRLPTAVISGTKDIAAPAQEHGDRIASNIPGAVSLELDCGHLAPIETPHSVAATMIDFLGTNEPVKSAQEMLTAAGMINRRRVLGDGWVDRSIANRTAFNGDFQDFITRAAWHDVWGRPGLDERTRRLLVVSVTAALGRWEEFRLHVRAGLQKDGFTTDELKEVLLQLAIYAGIPAANTAFSEATEILSELHSE